MYFFSSYPVILRSTVTYFSKLLRSLIEIFIFATGGLGLELSFSGLFFMVIEALELEEEDVLDELSSGFEMGLAFLEVELKKFLK